MSRPQTSGHESAHTAERDISQRTLSLIDRIAHIRKQGILIDHYKTMTRHCYERKLKMLPAQNEHMNIPEKDDQEVTFNEYLTYLVRLRFPVAGIDEMDVELKLFWVPEDDSWQDMTEIYQVHNAVKNFVSQAHFASAILIKCSHNLLHKGSLEQKNQLQKDSAEFLRNVTHYVLDSLVQGEKQQFEQDTYFLRVYALVLREMKGKDSNELMIEATKHMIQGQIDKTHSQIYRRNLLRCLSSSEIPVDYEKSQEKESQILEESEDQVEESLLQGLKVKVDTRFGEFDFDQIIQKSNEEQKEQAEQLQNCFTSQVISVINKFLVDMLLVLKQVPMAPRIMLSQLFRAIEESIDQTNKQVSSKQAELIYLLWLKPWLMENLEEYLEEASIYDQIVVKCITEVLEGLFGFKQIIEHNYLNLDIINKFQIAKAQLINQYFYILVNVEYTDHLQFMEQAETSSEAYEKNRDDRLEYLKRDVCLFAIKDLCLFLTMGTQLYSEYLKHNKSFKNAKKEEAKTNKNLTDAQRKEQDFRLKFQFLTTYEQFSDFKTVFVKINEQEIHDKLTDRLKTPMPKVINHFGNETSLSHYLIPLSEESCPEYNELETKAAQAIESQIIEFMYTRFHDKYLPQPPTKFNEKKIIMVPDGKDEQGRERMKEKVINTRKDLNEVELNDMRLIKGLVDNFYQVLKEPTLLIDRFYDVLMSHKSMPTLAQLINDIRVDDVIKSSLTYRQNSNMIQITKLLTSPLLAHNQRSNSHEENNQNRKTSEDFQKDMLDFRIKLNNHQQKLWEHQKSEAELDYIELQSICQYYEHAVRHYHQWNKTQGIFTKPFGALEENQKQVYKCISDELVRLQRQNNQANVTCRVKKPAQSLNCLPGDNRFSDIFGGLDLDPALQKQKGSVEERKVIANKHQSVQPNQLAALDQQFDENLNFEKTHSASVMSKRETLDNIMVSKSSDLASNLIASNDTVKDLKVSQETVKDLTSPDTVPESDSQSCEALDNVMALTRESQSRIDRSNIMPAKAKHQSLELQQMNQDFEGLAAGDATESRGTTKTDESKKSQRMSGPTTGDTPTEHAKDSSGGLPEIEDFSPDQVQNSVRDSMRATEMTAVVQQEGKLQEVKEEQNEIQPSSKSEEAQPEMTRDEILDLIREMFDNLQFGLVDQTSKDEEAIIQDLKPFPGKCIAYPKLCNVINQDFRNGGLMKKIVKGDVLSNKQFIDESANMNWGEEMLMQAPDIQDLIQERCLSTFDEEHIQKCQDYVINYEVSLPELEDIPDLYDDALEMARQVQQLKHKTPTERRYLLEQAFKAMQLAFGLLQGQINDETVPMKPISVSHRMLVLKQIEFKELLQLNYVCYPKKREKIGGKVEDPPYEEPRGQETYCICYEQVSFIQKEVQMLDPIQFGEDEEKQVELEEAEPDMFADLLAEREKYNTNR